MSGGCGRQRRGQGLCTVVDGVAVVGVVAALALVAAASARAPAALGKTAANPVAASQPGSYIASHTRRARECKGFFEPPWVSWLSYASATVGDEWRVTANSSRLCGLARRLAQKLIDAAPYDDGAGLVETHMLAYGLHVGRGIVDLPIGAHKTPRGYRCFALPSFWGALAWSYARRNHAGAPKPEEFAPASGPAAGAGYCAIGARLDAQAQWRGGKFFTWGPDTADCKRHYKLKEIPDPKNPGETTNPPFPAQLWGDYELVSC